MENGGEGNDYMSAIEVDQYVKYAQQYEKEIGQTFQSSDKKED